MLSIWYEYPVVVHDLVVDAVAMMAGAFVAVSGAIASWRDGALSTLLVTEVTCCGTGAASARATDEPANMAETARAVAILLNMFKGINLSSAGM
jgi:hypothetical protein